MGFNRTPSPSVISRSKATAITAAVHQFIAATELVAVRRAFDPFGVDDACPATRLEHFPIRSAGDLVCANCGNVFDRMRFF